MPGLGSAWPCWLTAVTDRSGVLDAGLCAPNLPNGGYDKAGKQVAVRYLRQVLSESYRRMAVRTTKLIAHARIPVLKLEMRNGIELDVSINDSAGVNAADFLQSRVSNRFQRQKGVAAVGLGCSIRVAAVSKWYCYACILFAPAPVTAWALRN